MWTVVASPAQPVNAGRIWHIGLCAPLPTQSHRWRWSTLLPSANPKLCSKNYEHFPRHGPRMPQPSNSPSAYYWASGVYDEARLDVWIRLCRIAIPPTLPDHREPAPHPPRQDAASSLRICLASPPGQALLQELRWALLRPPVALARLRAMGPCGRLADSALLATMGHHGAAVLCACRLSPIVRLPSGKHATFILLLDLWRCCLAARRQATLSVSFLQSCDCILYSRTQYRWIHGAHPAYLHRDAAPLCPDCWLMWSRSLQACSLRRRPPPPAADLLQHLRQAADSCQAGAGSQAALPSELRLKYIRLARIRHCNSSFLDSL